MSTFKDIAGQRFGRLVAVAHAGTVGRRALWSCLCDCGKTISVIGKSLLSGNTASCGCLRLATGRHRVFAVPTQLAPEAPAVWECADFAAFLWECFDPDFESGALTWKRRPRWHFATTLAHAAWLGRHAGKPAGHICELGYLMVQIKAPGLTTRPWLGHRLLWAMKHGNLPENIDHANGDRADNRMANLRAATDAQNNRNTPKRRAGLKGVSVNDSGRFSAAIGAGGRRYRIGTFGTEQEAHDAYVSAAKRLHGEFARAE